MTRIFTARCTTSWCTMAFVTCDFKELLEMSDLSVYNSGRNLMIAFLQNDVIAHGPLEAAYIWALATRAQLGGGFILHALTVQLKCWALMPGRIFPKADSNTTYQDWLTKIAPGVFYYADEKGRGKSHPPSIRLLVLQQ